MPQNATGMAIQESKEYQLFFMGVSYRITIYALKKIIKNNNTNNAN